MLEDDAYLARHVDVYFEHVHTTGCYGFLHEPSVREAMSEGRLSRSLALAMCAASTRFLSSTSGKTNSSSGDGAADPDSTGIAMAHRAQVWADEAKRLVFSRLYEYDLDALASLLLQFYHAVANAQFEVVRILASTAARMAVGMNLHVEEQEGEIPSPRGTGTTEQELEWDERPAQIEIRREKKRRIVWACQFFDWITCQGRLEDLALRPGLITVRLPAEDSSFLSGEPSDMPSLEMFDRDLADQTTNGAMDRHNPRSAYIHLMWIRTRVVQYVVGCPRASHPPWLAYSQFQALERELSEWSRRLPASLTLCMSLETSRSTSEPTLNMLLLMLEAWFHEACACLLGIVLPSAGLGGHLSVALPRAMIAVAPDTWLAHARQRCLDHCVAISEPARRGALASLGFAFEDVDFPLLAVESIERRMAWVDAEPVRAFDEEIMLPLAIHLEATFRSAAATRRYFPVVGPLLVAANQMLLHRGFPAMPAVERDLNPDHWYRQTISTVHLEPGIADSS
ncbi:hypothetical protein FFLO_05023 [Filobasidium floriforme]|uniref:Xylanolytic transcriptional activator regulatory domain-containing protein n=1 Tax=Filobasidium floriforme TaxID=5210 RepID=A0A8K0JJT0_9TREE|nr:uncharacterized protein HD553DRAFT_363776 [Filobasidium floriforme]KAG7530424.1 hypothetical protein FFLO_05023 [Filobasidium floriforme]KAH8078551.1 hypothetical protein HD553DRAFT_363776 [Filobasidium floriforme]